MPSRHARFTQHVGLAQNTAQGGKFGVFQELLRAGVQIAAQAFKDVV